MRITTRLTALAICLSMATSAFAGPSELSQDLSIVPYAGTTASDQSGGGSDLETVTGTSYRGNGVSTKSFLRSLFLLAVGYLSIQQIPGVDAGSIILPSPGTCVSQEGIATVQPSCFGNAENFTVSGVCCRPNAGVTLTIDATGVVAPADDCCNRCVGAGDQHAEDTSDKKVNLGPCLAKLGNSCTKKKALCDTKLCKWTGKGTSPCQFKGISPQINLLTVAQGNYGVNFTLGARNNVVTMTPFTLNDNMPLAKFSGSSCKNVQKFAARSGFAITGKNGPNGAYDWTITDKQTASEIDLRCQKYGDLDYAVAINKAFNITGFCKNSLTSDAVVDGWIQDYKFCGGNPLPPTLYSPTSYKASTVTTHWADLSKDLPPCVAGWIIRYLSGGLNMQVAVPLGTFVPDAPNQNDEPGLYDGTQVVTYVPPGKSCSCAPNPGGQLKLKYGGDEGGDTCE